MSFKTNDFPHTYKLFFPDASPLLLYKFSEQTLQPGPPVSLRCIAKGNPPPRIQWRLDGFPIPQTDRSEKIKIKSKHIFFVLFLLELLSRSLKLFFKSMYARELLYREPFEGEKAMKKMP